MRRLALAVAISLVAATARAETASEPADERVEERGPAHHHVASAAYGVRGARAFGDSSRADGSHDYAVLVGGSGSRFLDDGPWSFHGAHAAAIGGGSAGLAGELSYLLSWGTRIHVGEHHGPVIRAGARFDLASFGDGLRAVLELPRGEIGYQLIDDTRVLEIGFAVAPILLGEIPDGENPTGVALSGYAAAIAPWGRLEGRETRLGRSVSVIDARACVTPWGLAACGDVAVTIDERGEEKKTRTWIGALLGFSPALPL